MNAEQQRSRLCNYQESIFLKVQTKRQFSHLKFFITMQNLETNSKNHDLEK